MNRMFRNSLAFIVGFLFSAFFVFAYAETIPASEVKGYYLYSGTVNYVTRLAAIQAYSSGKSAYQVCQAGVFPSDGLGGTCDAPQDDTVNAHGCFWGGFSWSCHTIYSRLYTGCPSNENWTLVGANCTRPDCVAPQTRQPDGTCSAPQCTHAANAQVGGMYVIPRPVPSGVIWCASNCLVYMVTDSYSPTETFAKAYVNGAGGAASSCTGSSEVAPTPKDPEPTKTPTPCAQGQGVITNSAGKVVCVDQNAVPSAEPPKVNKTTETKTHPDGSQTINNITQTCTGEGACSTTTTTTTTNASNGQPGIAGTPGTTNSVKDKPAETQSDLCAQNPSLQICKGGIATEVLQKETLDEIKKFNNPTASDDSSISSKTFESTPGRSDLTTHDDSLKNYVIGAVVPGEVAASKGAWETAMSSGWFDPIERGGCQPYVATIAGKTWTWDYCQKADEIAQIGAYVLWVSLAFGIFVMLTGGQRS